MKVLRRQYKEVIDVAINSLSSIYDPREAKALSLNLFTTLFNIPDYHYITEPSKEITEVQLKIFDSALAQMLKGRPIQYVLGTTYFAGHDFRVKEGVLIPRPETEELFRLIIADFKERKERELNLIDLCTGSGCLAWSLADFFINSKVDACDLSDEALEIAKSQKGFSNSPRFFKSDLLSGSLDSISQKYDLIISNPPYVMHSEKALMAKNVLDFEPSMALFVSDNDPLVFYMAIADFSIKNLNNGGAIYLEINEKLGHETANLFIEKGFDNVEVLKDIFGKDRFLRVI